MMSVRRFISLLVTNCKDAIFFGGLSIVGVDTQLPYYLQGIPCIVGILGILPPDTILYPQSSLIFSWSDPVFFGIPTSPQSSSIITRNSSLVSRYLNPNFSYSFIAGKLSLSTDNTIGMLSSFNSSLNDFVYT